MKKERTIESYIGERNQLYDLVTRRAIRPTAAVNDRLRWLDRRIREGIPLRLMVDEGEVSDE